MLAPDRDHGVARADGGVDLAVLQQVDHEVLVFEHRDEAPQVCRLLELGLLDDVVRPGHLQAPRLGRVAEEDGALLEHQAHDPVAVVGQVAHARLVGAAHFLQRQPGQALVEQIDDAVQVVPPELGLHLQHDRLHQPALHADDEHQPRRRERHHLHPLQDARRKLRAQHYPQHVRQPPQQPRRLTQHVVRVADEAFQLGEQRLLLGLRERRRTHQAVDERPVAQIGRDAAGRGIGVFEVAVVLQVAHRVPDRRRAQADVRVLRQIARSHRPGRLDEVLDDQPEDLALALGEAMIRRTSVWLLGRVHGTTCLHKSLAVLNPITKIGRIDRRR